MKFEQLLKDIERLIGLPLKSIRPGADITIVGMDPTGGRIDIRTAKGELKSRPLAEVERIWTKMGTMHPIHVDQVLGGSGSSRNQPETILANLPNVEWLRFNGKKHVVNVGSPTHPYGTLKQMDDFQAEHLKQMLLETSEPQGSSVLVVTNDAVRVSQFFISLLNAKPVSMRQGIYKISNSSDQVTVASAHLFSGVIPIGTYAVVRTVNIPIDSIPVRLGDMTYHYYSSGELVALFHQTP